MKRTILLFLPPFLVFTLIFSVASFIISEKACDYAMSFEAKKEVPFNHKSHIEEYDADDCEMCHDYYSDGRFRGIPTLGVCKDCHNGDDAEELEAFEKFEDTDKPWEAFAKQPDLVYFSHKVVMTSNIETRCSSCHGDKENSTNTDRIEGKMLMGKCMDCHAARKISNKCLVCHD